MIATAIISSFESNTIDNTINVTRPISKPSGFNEYMIANNSYDNVHVVLSNILSIYDPVRLHENLLERCNVGAFAASIGSTTVGSTSPYVLDFDTVDSDNESSTNDNESDDDATITEWDQNLLDDMNIYLDALISSVGSTTASNPTGVTAKHLSKVWRIDTKTAEKTLDVRTQLLLWSDYPTLSRNFSTGDTMLRYKWIDQYFFMDTLFAHKKKGKSSQGYTCGKLFVTDQGFFHVIPMTNKSEVPMDLKMFAKDICAPDAIICDAAREQIFKEVRYFCYKIGTSIRVL